MEPFSLRSGAVWVVCFGVPLRFVTGLGGLCGLMGCEESDALGSSSVL